MENWILDFRVVFDPRNGQMESFWFVESSFDPGVASWCEDECAESDGKIATPELLRTITTKDVPRVTVMTRS